MKKYKDQDGIELSYEGHENDIHANLIKEVIHEAIRLGDEKISSKFPHQGWREVREFLINNFSLKYKRVFK